MKKIYHIKSYLWASIFAIALLSSCKKDNLINRTELGSDTRIMFVHGVQNGPHFNFFINDTKITGAPATADSLTQGMAYSTSNMPAYFGYASIKEGASTVRAIVPEASTTIQPGTVLVQFDHNFEKGKAYSVFTFDPIETIGSMIVEDNLVKEAQKAGIRFVNLMPNTAIDLQMTYTAAGSTESVTSLFATNVAYKAMEGFTAMEPGTYVFQRKRAGTNTNVGSALTITRLNAGQNFTLCGRGTTAAMLQIPHH